MTTAPTTIDIHTYKNIVFRTAKLASAVLWNVRVGELMLSGSAKSENAAIGMAKREIGNAIRRAETGKTSRHTASST